MSSAIDNFVSGFFQVGLDQVLHFETGVVRAEVNTHSSDHTGCEQNGIWDGAKFALRRKQLPSLPDTLFVSAAPRACPFSPGDLMTSPFEKPKEPIQRQRWFPWATALVVLIIVLVVFWRIIL